MARHSSSTRGNGLSRLVLCLCAALVVGLPAWPDTSWASQKMRCGKHLIGKGALQDIVLVRCGQPYSRYRNYWLYRKGQSVFRLRFNSRGEVSKLTSEIVY